MQIKKQTRQDLAANLFCEHPFAQASISPSLYCSYQHVGRVSADKSMSCCQLSAVSKKNYGGAGFHTSHSPTRCPALPRAQIPFWQLEGCRWGRGKKKKISVHFEVGECDDRKRKKKSLQLFFCGG